VSSEKGQTAAQVRVGSPVGDERINGHDGPQSIQQGSASLPAMAQKIPQGSPRRLPSRRLVWKPKVYKITHVNWGLETDPQNRYGGAILRDVDAGPGRERGFPAPSKSGTDVAPIRSADATARWRTQRRLDGSLNESASGVQGRVPAPQAFPQSAPGRRSPLSATHCSTPRGSRATPWYSWLLCGILAGRADSLGFSAAAGVA